VFDLGCAKGTTLLALDRALDPAIALAGLDNSPTMIEHATARYAAFGSRQRIEFRAQDLT
jgi:cyclopropane fatty-acyl-phospholipid synthase-like methyltransferase